MQFFSCIQFHYSSLQLSAKENELSSHETKWTFFSNYGHVYFILASSEALVVREIAQRVGITERSVLGIIQELEEAGYIEKEKVGRSNRYKIIPEKTLRHPLENNVQLKELINVINKAKKNS